MAERIIRARSPHAADVGRNVIWQSMRKLRRFTADDLVAVAEAKRGNVGKYIAALRDAGYLRCLQPAKSGHAGEQAIWQLVRDTGPLAPRLSLDGVYDGNLADPATIKASAKLCKHAPAMMKVLREICDAADLQDSALVACRIESAREVLARHDAGAIT